MRHRVETLFCRPLAERKFVVFNTIGDDLSKPAGKLICMTDLYSDPIDFGSWYYKNDRTHVFIYRAETLEHLRSRFNFRDLKIEGRLMEFTK